MKTKTPTGEDALESLVGMFEGDNGTPPDKSTVAALLIAAYEGYVGKYRPLIQGIPTALSNVTADIAPVAAALVKFASGIMGDAEYKAAMAEFDQHRANARFAMLKAYKAAGFKHGEAMALLLADANSQSSWKVVMDSVGNALKSRSDEKKEQRDFRRY